MANRDVDARGATTTDQAAGELLRTALSPAAVGISEQAQEAGRQLGEALVIGATTVATLFKPLKALVWGYEQIEAWLSENVAKKLEAVPPENRISPKLMIAGPTVEAIRFASEETELRNLFANLLVSSMDKRRTDGAHPAFVEMIKQLVPDEAKILRALPARKAIPVLQLHSKTPGDVSGEYREYYNNFTTIGEEAGIANLGLLQAYIDNLRRLELINIPPGISISDQNEYDKIEKHSFVEQVRQRLKADGRELKIDRGLLILTALGHQFCETCVWEQAHAGS